MSEEINNISPVELFLSKPNGLFPDSPVTPQVVEQAQTIVAQEITQPVAEVTTEVVTPPAQETKVTKEANKKIETPLFTFESNPNQDDNITDWDSFIKVATEKYGQKIENPQDAVGILAKIEEYSKSEKELLGQVQKAKALEDTIVGLPDDIKLLIHEYANGGDYKSALSSLAKQTDFSKDATAYDKNDLILMYNSDITSDDFEEMDEKSLNKLYNASVKLYNVDKEKAQSKIVSIKKANEQRQQIIESSIQESISYLKQVYPQMTNQQLEVIAGKMQNGYSLLDNNGYSKEAALKITMAEYGHDVIGQLRNSLEQEYKKKLNVEVSKELETIARHQNDTPNVTQSNPNTSEYSNKVNEAVGYMTKKSLF